MGFSALLYVSEASYNVIKHLMPNPFISIPAAMLFTLRMYLRDALSLITQRSHFADQFFRDLINDKHCTRQGFIYSYRDDVCNTQKVEEFIEARKKRGVNVKSIHFEDSVHVQHLRLHKEEYTDFIESILIDMEEENSEENSKSLNSKL